VIYRAKFAQTVFQARQVINHGHIRVNGKKVNISSYTVKENDVIEVKESSKQLAVILSAVSNKERDVPEYIVADHKQFSAKFTRVPKMEEIPYPALMEPNLVVEYYSR
jgi:small subunit ribosomal protein S4